MSSGIKKLKLNSTPNSSKLAEILLALKEDHQNPVMEPQMILQEHDFEESTTTGPETRSKSAVEAQSLDPVITVSFSIFEFLKICSMIHNFPSFPYRMMQIVKKIKVIHYQLLKHVIVGSLDA